jgi:hypothetical protein
MSLRGLKKIELGQRNSFNPEYQEGREFRGTRSRSILNRQGSNMRQRKARVKVNAVV